MATIQVTDAGPIEGTFSIDLSPGPGVYEFRGARGTGKTTCISSIDWLAGHKVDVTLHDGALSGKIEGFGVVAPIGGRKRRKGEFELDTIDAEKFSLTDILDPQGKTPEVRDATRIKAIVSLSDVKADPALYYELAGGQSAFDALGLAKTDDPVMLATRVKQAFDKLAREKENTAEAEAGHAAPLEVVPDGLDVGLSSDLEELGRLRDEARDNHKTLADKRANGLETEKEARDAKERLAKLKAEYTGLCVEDAEATLAKSIEWLDKARSQVELLEAKLEEARKTLDSRVAQVDLDSQKRETAKQHEEAVSALREAANQEISYPAPEEIVDANVKVAKASKAYDDGLRVRDVKLNQAKAKKHLEAAKQAEKEAAEARNKASQVFDILAQSLHTKHLQIQSVDGNPRLFVKHPKRGRTAFDQVNGLSDGERVDYTLRELLPHIESPGLLPIPQRVWQDLQPADRKRLQKLAVEKKLFVFGAQVDDGDLRVVYLGSEL